MKCSTSGCESTAVIQWSKLQDDETVSRNLGHLHTRLAEVAEERKMGLRFQIAALEEAREIPPKTLSPSDARAFEERANLQIKSTQREHDAVPTTFNLDHHRSGSVQALGACEDHKHEDADWYAIVHSSDCNGTKECGCS